MCVDPTNCGGFCPECQASSDANETRCICDFPSRCGGHGHVQCRGCGGDFCICAVCYGHGESECFGCDDCRGEPDDDYWEPEDDE